MHFSKKIVFIALSFFLYSLAMAQEVSFSEKEKSAAFAQEVEVIGTVNNKIVTYIASANNAQLVWYTQDLKRLGYTELTFFSNDVEQIDFSIVDNEVHILYQERFRHSIKLYATKIYDYDKFFKPVLLDSIETKGAFDKQTFLIKHNSSRGLHMYAAAQNMLTSESSIQLQFVVLDKTFNPINTYKSKLATERRYELVEINVSSDGHMYALLGERRINKKIFEELSFISKGTNDAEATNLAIDLKNYAYSSMRSSFFNNEQELFFGGLFYTNKFKAPSGVVALVYDKQRNEIVKQEVVPIMLQASRAKNNTLEHAILKSMRLKQDGGYEMIAEKSYVESRNTGRSMSFMSPFGGMNPGGGGAIERVYYDNEIFVFNVSALGQLEWTQSIIKKQESNQENASYSSYAQLEHPLGSVYLFNDQSGRDARIITSYLSNNGELALKQLSHANLDYYDNAQIIFRGAKQLSKDVLVAPAITKGEVSFVKIAF